MGIHTQRTIKFLAENGYKTGGLDAIVEKWVPRQRKNFDFLGIIDLFCFSPVRNRMIAVQSCGPDFAPHEKKIEAALKSDFRARILADTCGILLVGWSKRVAWNGFQGGRCVKRNVLRDISQDDVEWKKTKTKIWVPRFRVWGQKTGIGGW